ncbi:MAG: FG-GAP repeat domain-containing protein, partial [Vicinamibacteria bacterium]
MLVFLTLLTAASGPIFTEITKEAGIDFAHQAGNEGKYRLPEIMAPGGAFLDFDSDGDLDIYLVQSGPLPGAKSSTSPPSNRLYRQDASGRFTDVTDSSGLGDTGYGTGVAVGDYDNDGLVDVYVANYGPDALYHNEGSGKFSNATARAGIVETDWSASAVFCDFDADGFLDLYVTRYVQDAPKSCVAGDGSTDYCSPQSFSYEKHALYHNDGDGAFTDVSGSSGIAAIAAPGLGVLCLDLTSDGRPDFYVANDGEANQLWVNQGNGKFADEAFLMGAAIDGMGRPEASMGVIAGDIDSDLDFDLYMTHIQNQTNTLYVNDGKGGFEDQTSARGLAAPSLKYTGFGTAYLDFDHDGDLDIAVVNGRVRKGTPIAGAQVSEYWKPYAEPSLLLENDGMGRFSDASAKGGDFTSRIEVRKGLALGDVDSDGDLDLLVTNTGGP